MRPRPFRGILGAALLLCGLGPDLQPPPRAPPRPEEIEALAVELTGAGINTLELTEHVGQDLHEFMRVGRQCLGIFKMLLAQGQRVTVVADLVRKHDELVGAIPAAGTERVLRLGGGEGPVKFHPEPRFRGQSLPVGHGTAGFLEVTGRRGPGIQLRDERTRVGEPLRILAQYTGMTSVERGLRVPTPEQWEALQVALPDLGPMEAPPTEAERSPVLTAGERRVMHEEYRPGMRMRVVEPEPEILDIELHLAGRCTCGGGGAGDCEWCRMDQRRYKREVRQERRRPPPQVQPDAPERLDLRDMLGPVETRDEERARKREAQRAKQARRRRTGRR